MNTHPDPQHEVDGVQDVTRERPEPPGPDRPDLELAGVGGVAPEAVQAADVHRAGLRLRPDVEAAAQAPTRGVDWVRPTDLIARAGGVLSRRGIDVHEELMRRTRSGIGARTRQIATLSMRLPSLSAFGREEPAADARGLGRG